MEELLFYVICDEGFCLELLERDYPFFDTSKLEVGDGILEFTETDDSTLIGVKQVKGMLVTDETVHSDYELFNVLSHPMVYKLYANRSYGDIAKFVTKKLGELS